MEFYITVPEEVYEKVNEFHIGVGYLMWNIAVMLAPYDTGNLRRSITMTKNGMSQINIRYNTMQANYIKFLEEGIGPVKKHKQFIELKTRLAMVEQLIIWLKSGKVGTFTRTPYVHLRESKKPFFTEKAILFTANMRTNLITANERRKISQIRETSFRIANNQKLSSFRGEKVLTNRTRGRAGTSILTQMHQQAKLNA